MDVFSTLNLNGFSQEVKRNITNLFGEKIIVKFLMETI